MYKENRVLGKRYKLVYAVKASQYQGRAKNAVTSRGGKKCAKNRGLLDRGGLFEDGKEDAR